MADTIIHRRMGLCAIVTFLVLSQFTSIVQSQTACDSYGCEQGCTVGASGPECSCDNGYVLDDNGLNCHDKDECEESVNVCTHICTNSIGSFGCSCFEGYTRNQILVFLCNDVDECVINNGGCEDVCTNSEGSYNCSCINSTYTLWSDGHQCDINECADDNGGCEQVCTNTLGDFDCSCADGYYLTNDNKTCQESPTTETSLDKQKDLSTEVTVSIVIGFVVLVTAAVVITLTVIYCVKKSTVSPAKPHSRNDATP